MEYKLTCKLKHAKHCKDGKDRNILQYFLNNILILEQKYPFDDNYDNGYQYTTDIHDEYLLNGNLYQTRQYESSSVWWRRFHNKQQDKDKIRNVKYPISKKILEQFNIPKDYRITLS